MSKIEQTIQRVNELGEQTKQFTPAFSELLSDALAIISDRERLKAELEKAQSMERIVEYKPETEYDKLRAKIDELSERGSLLAGELSTTKAELSKAQEKIKELKDGYKRFEDELNSSIRR